MHIFQLSPPPLYKVPTDVSAHKARNVDNNIIELVFTFSLCCCDHKSCRRTWSWCFWKRGEVN